MLNHEELVRRAHKLPALPPSCHRMAVLATQDSPDHDELEEIVSLDPMLTAKVLRLANSGMFGPFRTTGTVKDAVVRMGPQALLGVLMGHATGHILKKDVRALGYPGEGLWRHSISAAVATMALTQKCPQLSSPFAFTSALLHDVGKVVVDQVVTTAAIDACHKVVIETGKPPFEAEAETLAVQHGEVSAIILERWLLPEIMVKSVTSHHSPDKRDPNALVVYAADAVAHDIDGRKPSPAELETLNSIRGDLGITPGDFVRICQTTADRVKQVGALYG